MVPKTYRKTKDYQLDRLWSISINMTKTDIINFDLKYIHI